MTTPSTPSYTPATHRVVARSVADEVIASAKALNFWMTFDLAAVAGLVTVIITLLSGPKYPLPLYYALTVFIVLVLVLSLAAYKEWKQQTPGQQKLDEATSEAPYTVAMQVVASGAPSTPSITGGGQQIQDPGLS